MNFILMPSLEHMAVIKAAILMWNQNDIVAKMAKSRFRSSDYSEQKWQTIEDDVIKKTQSVMLPESLKKKVLGFIKPIGFQILKWKEFHENFIADKKFVRRNLKKLCWTPQGTVDKQRTAQELIKDENLDITRRYKLACVYCLENDIPILWNRIPENRRKYFYSGKNSEDVKQHELVTLWTYCIKNEIDKLDDVIVAKWRKVPVYQFAFEFSVFRGNKAATEYFLQKLTPTEKKESLGFIPGFAARQYTDVSTEEYSDILCFLFSQLNKEEQMEVFKGWSYYVLKCFLDWPWQIFFMDVAECMWSSLSEDDYSTLLGLIIDKVRDNYGDFNYQELFSEFWEQSPMTHKRYVINECVDGSFLISELFDVEDIDNIKLILKYATEVQKQNIIFCDMGQYTCQELIYTDKWTLLEFFIQECLLSKKDMKKLKEKFRDRLKWYYTTEKFKKEDKCEKFFTLMDSFIRRYNKRKNPNDIAHSAPVKRPYNLRHKEYSYR